jgi:hypothetical protein
VADGGSSAGDGASAPHLAAVVVEGGEPDQRGDALPGAAAEFGQLAQQRPGGLIPHAGDRLERALLLTGVLVHFDQRLDLLLDLFDLLLDPFNHLPDALGGIGVMSLLKPVALGGAHGDELAAAGAEIGPGVTQHRAACCVRMGRVLIASWKWGRF